MVAPFVRALCASTLVALPLACSSTPAPPASGPVDITTDKGVVHGSSDGVVRSFLGIPYAAPPVGALRFMPPAPAAAWSTPRDANSFGAECAQLSSGALAAGSSEDCLYLNVWAPNADVKNAPVLVWIHGGGFVQGSGNDTINNGAKLVEHTNAIVVTLNYRLGALGWLSHPAFAAAENVATSPSQGLLDQQAALQWVQKNIAAFGGDPANVTVGGESAGASSVCAQLAMPGSKGLFAHAIIESGVCLNQAVSQPAVAIDQGTRLGTAVGCTDPNGALACLQGKTPLEILAALPLRKALFGATGDLFVPVADGTTLPKPPLDAMVAGEATKVPTLLGTNLNEGQLFLTLWGSPPPTSTEVRDTLGVLFDAANVDAIAAQYPVDADAPNAFVDLITDAVFVCPARKMARALATAGAPTYLYQVTYPLTIAAFPGLVMAHGFELPLVFRNGYIGAQLSDADVAMADVVDAYWFSLATSGDPNATRAPSSIEWPAYSTANDTNVVLDTTTSTNAGLKSAKCDFWDTIL
jgi:para-nitrobenzyl esterase